MIGTQSINLYDSIDIQDVSQQDPTLIRLSDYFAMSTAIVSTPRIYMIKVILMMRPIPPESVSGDLWVRVFWDGTSGVVPLPHPPIRECLWDA